MSGPREVSDGSWQSGLRRIIDTKIPLVILIPPFLRMIMRQARELLVFRMDVHYEDNAKNEHDRIQRILHFVGPCC